MAATIRSGACTKLAVAVSRWILRRSSQGGSEAHPHARTAVIGAAADAEDRSVHARDLIDDREPEAAADPGRARAAIEALAHPGAFGFRNPGTIIFDLQERARAVPGAADRDMAAPGRVLERIVEQILQQILEQARVPTHAGGVRFGPQIDADLVGPIDIALDQFLDQRLEGYGCGILG